MAELAPNTHRTEGPARAARVLLACSGLDHARRGYESFARACFDVLRDDPRVEIELVKGSGAPGPYERAIPVLRRDSAVGRGLGTALQVRPFRLEALAFGLSLQPLLERRRPDVVYLSEWDTASVIARSRRITRLPFKVLLCNGGFATGGFERFDHVQELTPAARDYVVERGADPATHTVLPLGFHVESELQVLSAEDRVALRKRLGLPRDRRIVVSVAALNRSHKRLDYLIDELALVPEPRPFVLLVGEPDRETPGLRSFAAERLGAEGHEFRTVAADQVRELLQASDQFVLTSLAEMQGRAVIEAMSEGLPCVVHDSPVMRFAVGEHGAFADFAIPGSLTRLLGRNGPEPLNPEDARARHRHVYERFSWDRLRSQYVQLLSDVARGEVPNRIVSSSTGEKLSR